MKTLMFNEVRDFLLEMFAIWLLKAQILLLCKQMRLVVNSEIKMDCSKYHFDDLLSAMEANIFYCD